MSGHEITLTWWELDMAGQVGLRRAIESMRGERRDVWLRSAQATWAEHVEGACGELAYAKFRGVYWNGSVNNFRGGTGDVGALVQIRTRSRHDYELFVRPHDKDDHFFVLVTGVAPVYRIVGWIRGADAKQERWLHDHGGRGKPAFFVPQAALREFRRGDGVQEAAEGAQG